MPGPAPSPLPSLKDARGESDPAEPPEVGRVVPLAPTRRPPQAVQVVITSESVWIVPAQRGATLPEVTVSDVRVAGVRLSAPREAVDEHGSSHDCHDCTERVALFVSLDEARVLGKMLSYILKSVRISVESRRLLETLQPRVAEAESTALAWSQPSETATEECQRVS